MTPLQTPSVIFYENATSLKEGGFFPSAPQTPPFRQGGAFFVFRNDPHSAFCILHSAFCIFRRIAQFFVFVFVHFSNQISFFTKFLRFCAENYGLLLLFSDFAVTIL